MPRKEPTFDNPEIYINNQLDIPDIPDGFILLQDTREQMPLWSQQRLSKGVLEHYRGKMPVTGCTLSTGDYSIMGYEDKVCIELKRWSDFIGFIGRERTEHTIPKLERMSKMFWSGLVIQEEPDHILFPRLYAYNTTITTNHIRGFLKSVEVRYGVHVYVNKNKELCRMWILDRLLEVYKILKEQESKGE